MAQAIRSGGTAAGLVSSAADAVTEVARLLRGSAAIADASKRARASISAVPRWLPWLVLIAFSLGLAVGFVIGRPRRGADRQTPPPSEAEAPPTESAL
jgi:hypothetical protein